VIDATENLVEVISIRSGASQLSRRDAEGMVHAERFHHVALTVTDRDASADWYQRVLGLVELFREDGDERRACVMGFSSGGFAVGVVEHRSAVGHKFDPRRTGLDRVAFAVNEEAGDGAAAVGRDGWMRAAVARSRPLSGRS
jgi:glyoxylase I family protein